MARHPLRAGRPAARSRGAERIEEFPAAEALDRLKAWTGADITLPELNGAQRQRRMIDAGASPFEVYAKCVEETRATYETAV